MLDREVKHCQYAYQHWAMNIPAVGNIVVEYPLGQEVVPACQNCMDFYERNK